MEDETDSPKGVSRHATTVSVIVAAYNKKAYVGQCIESLINQTLSDIEIIIVDDASTDGSSEIIRFFAEKDKRIHVIRNSRNMGRHVTRKIGCAASTGKYLLFVDADDELESTACDVLTHLMRQLPVSILHFGRTVIGETQADKENAYDTELLFNVASTRLEGEQISKEIFSDQGTLRNVWSVIDCLYEGDFLRKAFMQMTSNRLDLLEDTYEFFVISHCAKSYDSRSEYRGLRYYEGRGVSGRGHLSFETFVHDQYAMHQVVVEVSKYAEESQDTLVKEHACWFNKEVQRILGTEWVLRLTEVDQAKSMRAVADTWGNQIAASIFVDPVLGRARWLWEGGSYPPSDDVFFIWKPALEPLIPQIVDKPSVQDKFDELNRLTNDIQYREDERLENNRRQKEQEQRALNERLRLEAEQVERENEANRLFKKGTMMRRIVDTLLPENSRLRLAVRGFVAPFRH